MKQCLAFTLGANTLGMDIAAAVEVLSPTRVKPVPDMPEHIPGVISVRGEMIPLVDMRLRLCVEPMPSRERAIIVRSVVGKVALLVDGVSGIIGLDPQKLRKPRVMFHGLKSKYLIGLYGEGDDLIILLNTDEILTTSEKILLGKLRRKRSRVKS